MQRADGAGTCLVRDICAMTDSVAAPLCHQCGKPLDMMTVGLNGKDYHLHCFEAACKKTLTPVKDALRRVLGK